MEIAVDKVVLSAKNGTETWILLEIDNKKCVTKIILWDRKFTHTPTTRKYICSPQKSCLTKGCSNYSKPATRNRSLHSCTKETLLLMKYCVTW